MDFNVQAAHVSEPKRDEEEGRASVEHFAMESEETGDGFGDGWMFYKV